MDLDVVQSGEKNCVLWINRALKENLVSGSYRKVEQLIGNCCAITPSFHVTGRKDVYRTLPGMDNVIHVKFFGGKPWNQSQTDVLRNDVEFEAAAQQVMAQAEQRYDQEQWQRRQKREHMQSFGKSTILQMHPILTGQTAIVIEPLNQIQDEQAEKINRLGGRAIVVNKDTRYQLTQGEYEALRSAQHSHIFIGPELATSEWFRPIISSAAYQTRLGLIVLDEAHLVKQWGDEFRKEYGRMHVVRHIAPPRAPWFACSATLDRVTLNGLIETAKFREYDEMRTDIDRPEIEIRVARLGAETQSHLSSLLFVLDAAVAATETIESEMPATQAERITPLGGGAENSGGADNSTGGGAENSRPQGCSDKYQQGRVDNCFGSECRSTE